MKSNAVIHFNLNSHGEKIIIFLFLLISFEIYSQWIPQSTGANHDNYGWIEEKEKYQKQIGKKFEKFLRVNTESSIVLNLKEFLSLQLEISNNSYRIKILSKKLWYKPDSAIEDLNASGESLVELSGPKPKKKKKL